MQTFDELPFYRGVRWATMPNSPIICTTRKNRRPRNLSNIYHRAADQWFADKFHIRYRSQALFITSALASARLYGSTPQHVVRIKPIGEYHFCWSSRRADLFASCFDSPSIEDFIRRLNDSNYIEGDIEEAYNSGHEVMLYCDQYAAIPADTDPDKSGGIVVL